MEAPTMARKPHSSEVRKGTISAETLRDHATQLTELSAAMDSASKGMEDANLEELMIDGATKVERACVLVMDYIGNVEKALSRARLQGRRRV